MKQRIERTDTTTITCKTAVATFSYNFVINKYKKIKLEVDLYIGPGFGKLTIEVQYCSTFFSSYD